MTSLLDVSDFDISTRERIAQEATEWLNDAITALPQKWHSELKQLAAYGYIKKVVLGITSAFVVIDTFLDDDTAITKLTVAWMSEEEIAEVNAFVNKCISLERLELQFSTY